MGILGVFNNAITLVNRTSRDLIVRYDGEDIVLKPGENPGFPTVAVPYAKKQNPLMGSKHPINPLKFISLVGVKGKDDCSPISDETLAKADQKLEVVDRTGEFHGRPMRQNVKVLNTGFDPFEADVASGDMSAILGDANSSLDRTLG